MGVRTGLSSVPHTRQAPPPDTHKANEVGASSIPQQMGSEALQGHSSGSSSGDDHILQEKGQVSAGRSMREAHLCGLDSMKPPQPQLPVLVSSLLPPSPALPCPPCKPGCSSSSAMGICNLPPYHIQPWSTTWVSVGTDLQARALGARRSWGKRPEGTFSFLSCLKIGPSYLTQADLRLLCSWREPSF